jgi:hypothetical protein
MDSLSLLDENWHILLDLLPSNWKELAKQTGAMIRKFRIFPSEENLLRTLLMHIAKGYSLRETVVKANEANIAQVSDVALLKRLRASEEWFKSLCSALFEERGVYLTDKVHSKVRMRLVDGTSVKEPGKTGSLWKIHYSLVLPNLECDYFKITGEKGKGTAEQFNQFPIKKGDCIIGDRGYALASGIEYIAKEKGFSIVRVNTGTLKFYTNKKEKFDLLTEVKQLETAGQIGEWKVGIKANNENLIKGRLCIVRKSEAAIAQSVRKLKRKARKDGTNLKEETIEYAKYVIIFTTLPIKEFSASSVLEWYRLRWQIELVFKRLKSLAGLGHLPKYDEISARAWLYGKLLVGLLTEKLIRRCGDFSPWGYRLQE